MDIKLVLSTRDLQKLPLDWFVDRQQRFRLERSLRKMVGAQYDNTRTVLEVYKHLYNIQVYKYRFYRGSSLHRMYPTTGLIFDEQERVTNSYSVHIWDVTGDYSIYNASFTATGDNPVPSSVRRELLDEVKLFRSGKIRCSDCGEIIDQQDIAGKFFAGSYCGKCWEETWRKVAAKETYN